MFTEAQQATINEAIAIIEGALQNTSATLDSVAAVRTYLKLHINALEHEVFAVLFLNNKHRLIALEKMFRGTIDGASVYPREVAKAALIHNAAAVMFAHNHPSGVAEPSQADIRITERLIAALELLDVRVLDHFIVGHDEIFSFAQHGLL